MEMAVERFSSKGQAWFCTTGLPSDIVVEVGEMTFHLHKFPLMSKSRKLHDLIAEQEAAVSSDSLARLQAAGSIPSERDKQKSEEEEDESHCCDVESEIEVVSCHIVLPDFPGGTETFEVAAKFCYGVKMDLTAANAVPLRCAGEVLQMTEEYSEDNLIPRTERFLSKSVFRNLKDSIKALKSCENVMPLAEELGIVQGCIDVISSKAALVDPSLFGWPVNESAGASDSNRSLRIKSQGKKSKTPAKSKAGEVEPWFEELSVLSSDFFNRVLEAMKARELSSDVIENCLLHYAKRCFPGLSRSSKIPVTTSSVSSSLASEADQRELLETVVARLPKEKCSSSSRSTKILFGLLRTANILSVSKACKCILEKKIGAQLELANLDDLLIPSYSYLNETLYDVECVERILGYFLDGYGENSTREEDDHGSLMLVGKLIDGYLSEIASDSNLKPDNFYNLAMSLPDQARQFDDGLYRAVDVYLKAHPWLPESDREKICGVMDCRKLTMEACTHAAHNERLPLRAVVQVLFFEQLQLRHAIAGTLMAAEDGAMEQEGRLSVRRDSNTDEHEAAAVAQESGTWRAAIRENQVLRLDMDTMRTRVHELEHECSSLKKVIEKVAPPTSGGGSWRSSVSRRFGCRFKAQVCDSHEAAVVQAGKGRNAARHRSR